MRTHRRKIIILVVASFFLLLVAFAVTNAVYRNTNTPTTKPTPSSSAKSESSPEPSIAPTQPPTSGAVQKYGIPTSATVLGLAGMDFHLTDDMPEHFQGIFSRSPYNYVEVDYPRSASKTSISTGITNLNNALRTIPGKKIVLAHSQGAQVASGWMRQYAGDGSAPPAADVTFILTGNPLRASGGYGIGRLTWDGTLGLATPTDTKWHIVDVARRYDGWPDWPSDASNKEAVDNASKGKSTIHLRYDEVNLYAASNTSWNRGNTTFVVTEEQELPLYVGKGLSQSDLAAARSRIEAAYHRH